MGGVPRVVFWNNTIKRNLWEEGEERVVMVMGTERKKNVNVYPAKVGIGAITLCCHNNHNYNN